MSIPPIPVVDLPRLSASTKTTSLTRTLTSMSLKSSSPSRSQSKSKNVTQSSATPSPLTSAGVSKSPTKSSVVFPQIPSSPLNSPMTELTPRTPTTSSQPATPVRQRSVAAATVRSSSRRDALYERLRQRSLTASPTKAANNEVTGRKLTRDQMLKMGQDELRRRYLLARLAGVAESVWMMFSAPTPGVTTSATVRKRRALLMSEVTTAVVKSSPVPLSSTEAADSLTMPAKFCPLFLKQLAIAGEEWLEMPAGSVAEANPSTKLLAPGISRRVNCEALQAGGLREAMEIIRRQLELLD
ncbi:hypothetical protein B0H14DRAFT_2338273 [Mycena olivaceomarginata]|nr:hypothetical protein B0H14DRAFT_2338273 [Mycena olivaceomarginata]